MEGCGLVQVIQDRLYPFQLAYSWLLALGGSRNCANQKDEAQGRVLFSAHGKEDASSPQTGSLSCHGHGSVSLLDDFVIVKLVLKGNSLCPI